MLILTIYLILCSLASGPTAIFCFNQTLSGKTTPRAKFLILNTPPLFIVIITLIFCTILTTSSFHLPQKIEEAETNTQIRGTQIVFAITSAILFLGGYFTTLGTCLKIFGNTEIEETYEDEEEENQEK